MRHLEGLFQKFNNANCLVGILTISGLLLRLPALGSGLWRDEGSTYLNALPDAFGGVIRTVAYSELNPPGFYLLMSGWMRWFGAEEIIFKLPALLFGVLLIPAIYFVGKAAFSKNAGLISAAIAVFSPEAIYYSQEARPYTLAALLSCLTVLFFLKLLREERRREYFIGFVICAGALLYAQYTGLLLLACLGILTVFFRWRGMRSVPLIPLLISFAIIFILFFPWLPIFLTHLNTGAPWKTQYSWLGRFQVFFYNIAYTIPLLRLHSAGALLALTVLTMAGLKRLFLKPSRSLSDNPSPLAPPGTIIATCFLLPAILLAGQSLRGRYMLPFAPFAWIMYGSWLVASFRYVKNHWSKKWYRRCRAIMVAFILILFVVPNSIAALRRGNMEKSGIRSLAIDLQGKHPQNTLYLTSPDYLAPTCAYYFSGQNIELHGFGRWDNPQLFSPRNYAEIWNEPGLVEDILQRIRVKIREGYGQLILIQERRVRDYGRMPYSRSNDFLSVLRKTYTLMERKEYPATREPVTLYVFKLNP